MALAENLISREKSVTIAADVQMDKLGPLVQATCNVEGISGYKVGIVLGLDSLKKTVDTIREHTSLPVIYDHQKAGNDIPEMGTEFVGVCKRAGVDAVILFPFGGPVTQENWTKASQDAGLTVLTGGHMTQPKFLASEGGYIADDAPERIYRLAASLGTRDFVVPGNKVDYVRKYRQILQDATGDDKFRLWAPGFIKQGGEISEFALEAGEEWVAIVGSAVYKAENIAQAAEQITSNIR